MFDKKFSCVIRGIIGLLFGCLALLLPDLTLGTFYALFWVLIVIGILLFGFLGITGRGDESVLWFILAAALLAAGVLSVIFAGFVALLLILIIAGITAYNGFSDIMLALAQPKTKYILIPAIVLTGFAFLALLFYYFPGFEKNLYLSIVGALAIAFGLFSVMLGFYKGDECGPVPEKTAFASYRSRVRK
jgi:hypothetical protein